MAVFSTNQVRQLYVINSCAESPADIPAADLGAVALGTTPDGHIYFTYKGNGGVTRSDLIDVKNILNAKSADPKQRPVSAYEVNFNSSVDDLGYGQDYILRIAFRNYVGISEEDQYFKYGMVHVTSVTTQAEFWKGLAVSLAKNFSKEEEGLLNIYLKTNNGATTYVKVTKDIDADSLVEEYVGLLLFEAPQPWKLGVLEQTPVNFAIQPVSVNVNGDEVLWAEVDPIVLPTVTGGPLDTSGLVDPTVIKNGHKIADLEYFCMGARGDIYRNVGFPHVIQTKYMVDPEAEYCTLNIHYAYIGSNESSQKSEKDITIVAKYDEYGASAMNSLIDAINSATSLSIEPISWAA